MENSNAKVRVSGLLGVVLHILLSTGDEEICNLQVDELITCFGMGIALLSMQIEVHIRSRLCKHHTKMLTHSMG